MIVNKDILKILLVVQLAYNAITPVKIAQIFKLSVTFVMFLNLEYLTQVLAHVIVKQDIMII